MAARSALGIRTALIVIVVVCLAVDAFVHFDLASAFKNVKTSTLSQADLFYVEAILAIVAGVALLVRPRRYTAGFAFLVAAGGFVAVVLYRYVDVGSFGPIPDMYDPFWGPTGKWLSAVAEAVAAVAALAVFVMIHAENKRGAGVADRSDARVNRGQLHAG
jgi:hypothetical protein